MRPLDLAAVATVMAAIMMAVQATWTPPLMELDAADEHVGHRVRVQGFAVDVKDFGGEGRLVLVADGAALHAAFTGDPPTGWVEAIGTVTRRGGLPLLEMESMRSASGPTELTPIIELASDPSAFTDEGVKLTGFVQGNRFTADGVVLRLQSEADNGHQTLSGVLRYDPSCVCHVFHA